MSRPAPTRYLVVPPLFEDLIADTFPGGFAGWLEELDAPEPDLLVLGLFVDMTRGPEFLAWLNSRFEPMDLAVIPGIDPYIRKVHRGFVRKSARERLGEIVPSERRERFEGAPQR